MLRKQYSDEDKGLIQKFLQAKGTLRQKETVVQLNNRIVQEETDQEGSSGKIFVLCKHNKQAIYRTFTKKGPWAVHLTLDLSPLHAKQRPGKCLYNKIRRCDYS